MLREIATKIGSKYPASTGSSCQFAPVLLRKWRASTQKQAFRDRN
jgi:hypothetical protein